MRDTSEPPIYVIHDQDDDKDNDDDNDDGRDHDRQSHIITQVSYKDTTSSPVYLLHPTPVIGVCVSIFSSLLWGLYPVLCRYIMLHEPGKPQSTALLAVLMSINSIATGGYYLLRPLCHDSRIENEDNKATLDENEEDANPSKPNKLKVACLYGLLCLVRMQTNMASTRMTHAYNTQMTAMSLPFFTALLAKIFLFEKIHFALFPALIIMLIGGCLVFYGQGAFTMTSSVIQNSDNDNDNNDFDMEDLFGILLQLLSVMFSAGVKIAFKSTEGILDKTELLLSQFLMSAIPLVPYALVFEWPSVHALMFELDAHGIICMIVGLAFGIYIIGNVTQIYAARSIGASNHAASNSMRLVSAVFGSSIILNEPLNKPIEWIGMLLIIISILGYWYIRNYRKRNVTNVNINDVDIHRSNESIYSDRDKVGSGAIPNGKDIGDDNDNQGIEMNVSIIGINHIKSNGKGVVYNPLARRDDDDGDDCSGRLHGFETDTSIDVSRHEW